MKHDDMTTPSITEQSSKKTTGVSHLITPPRSTEIEPRHCTSPSQVEKTTMVNRHIFNAALFITSTWKKHHDIPSLFASTSTVSTTSFTAYLTEILKRSRCSMSALHAALFYIHKLTPQIHAGTDKNLTCPKKVLLVCLNLSFKFQYDSTFNLKAWSKISGLSVGELKQLEMGVLNALDYKIALNNKEFDSWLEKVEIVNSTTATSATFNKRARDDELFETVKKVKVSCA